MTIENQNSRRNGRRVQNALLWAVQLLLAAAFTVAGATKVITPSAELAAAMDWDVPLNLIRFIGAAELAGAAGLVLPALTRVMPRLTPAAAAGLMTVMLLATGVHLGREEFGQIPFPLVLGALAAFVWWGRTRWVPVSPRRPARELCHA